MLYFLAAKATIKDPEFAMTAPFFRILSAEMITLWTLLIWAATSEIFISLFLGSASDILTCLRFIFLLVLILLIIDLLLKCESKNKIVESLSKMSASSSETVSSHSAIYYFISSMQSITSLRIYYWFTYRPLLNEIFDASFYLESLICSFPSNYIS